jgi:glycosyltransferase involved in cell wall biosynthesis
MTVTVGVAIPAYMHAGFIEVTLRSAFAQSRPPDVVVVVDDCSDDATAEIAGRFEGVTLIRHTERQGPTATTADAIERCGTDFVAVLDGDDTITPDRVERQVAMLIADESLAVVGGLLQPFDASGNEFGSVIGTPGRHAVADWVRGGMLAGGSTLMVRAPFVNHDRRLTWASDWKFVIDNLAGGRSSFVIDDVIGNYRRHAASVSTKHRVNGLSDHVLMCDAMLAEPALHGLRHDLSAQRALKRCQLGEAHLADGSNVAAMRAFVGALVDSRGRLAKPVVAAVRSGLRAR